MANEPQLYERIAAEFRHDPRVGADDVGIALHDGIVTLTGTVATYAAKLSAARAAQRIPGVLAVANDVAVRPRGHQHASDTDLAIACVLALRWDAEAPADAIRVRVENGWVTLEGEVDWHYQRIAAEQAVSTLIGVRGITDLVRVVGSVVPPEEIRARILDAISRAAIAEPRAIAVTVDGSVVALDGSVRSWPERDLAEAAAWNCAGVTEVRDRLVVAQPGAAAAANARRSRQRRAGSVA